MCMSLTRYWYFHIVTLTKDKAFTVDTLLRKLKKMF